MTLLTDIFSMFHPAGKPIIYGVRGEKVTLIADHGEVLIVEGRKGRFSVIKKQIQA